MKKYYDEFEKILNKVKSGEINKSELNKYLVENIDCEYIYEGNDFLLSDIFFTLKHFALEEEDITQDEIEYFLECLKGHMKHSFTEKCEWLQNRNR